MGEQKLLGALELLRESRGSWTVCPELRTIKRPLRRWLLRSTSGQKHNVEKGFKPQRSLPEHQGSQWSNRDSHKVLDLQVTYLCYYHRYSTCDNNIIIL